MVAVLVPKSYGVPNFPATLPRTPSARPPLRLVPPPESTPPIPIGRWGRLLGGVGFTISMLWTGKAAFDAVKAVPSQLPWVPGPNVAPKIWADPKRVLEEANARFGHLDTPHLNQLHFIREKQAEPLRRDPMRDPHDRRLVVPDDDGNWIQIPLEGQETGALAIGDLWENGFPRRSLPERADDERRLIEIELGRRNFRTKAPKTDADKSCLEQYADYVQELLEALRKRANGEDVPLPTLVITTPEEEMMESRSKPDIACSAGSSDAASSTAEKKDSISTKEEPVDLALIKRGGFSDEELAMLSDAELRAVQRSVKDGLTVNSTFKRSNYYPFPRDLGFPAEKPLFLKWAANKLNVVEIGVFEGASAIIFRRAMSPKGTLHLIDPYVIVPDSGLIARPWMAKLNLLRAQNGTVRWHRDYSGNVAKGWNQAVDLLFIDGDHSYKGTKSDWDKWHDHVVAGGIVMFHDARMGKLETNEWDGWPGPTRVVDELFRGDSKLPNWEIVEEKGSLVVVQRVY